MASCMVFSCIPKHRMVIGEIPLDPRVSRYVVRRDTRDVIVLDEYNGPVSRSHIELGVRSADVRVGKYIGRF
jgi:hypothetical protein